MQTSITGRRTLIWLVVVLLLFIGISFIVASDNPETFPDFVSESPSPTGVKAFYTYLGDQNSPVERWNHSPELLTAEDDNQLLIMVGPSFTPDTRGMEEYVSFMASGNTILLLKTNPDGMFDVETAPAAADSGHVMKANGNAYEADIHSTFRINPKPQDNVLLHDNAGAIAVERTYKKGKLITAVAPEWLTNKHILKKDHLELVLSLIQKGHTGRGTIYFDEYVHGSENAPDITSLYPDWLLVLGLQAILFAGFWLWHEGKRFGPVMVPREESVRFSDERIRALAAWYQRGNRYADALRVQTDYLKRLLQERWGIPYYKDWPDIAEQLERKMTSDQKLDTFLNELTHVLNQENMSKKSFVAWSKKIDRLRKEVEKE